VIYVYRKSRVLGALVRTVIFVNHERLGELHNSKFVRTEVPAGKVEVIATGGYTGHKHLDSPPTPGAWSSLPGCAALDWRGLFWAPLADVQLCSNSLMELSQRCEASVGGVGPMRTIHIPACNSQLIGTPAVQERLMLAMFELKTSIEAEAGHTYYVRYMIKLENRIPNVLELVDAANGAKEMKGMHLAKD